MAWVLRNNWPWTLLAFLVGAIITWLLLNRRPQSPAEVPAEHEEPVEEKTLVGAGVTAAGTTPAAPTPKPEAKAAPTPKREPASPKPEPKPKPEPAAATPEPEPKPAAPTPKRKPEPEPAAMQPVFSQRMDAGEPTLFDDAGPAADEVQVKSEDVPPGRYGEGSADAVAHQGPPDGFTIKGNVQSMLFHTPDSPYYGRTKPEVWFRTEADAESAGFTKYVRKPRKSTRPTN